MILLWVDYWDFASTIVETVVTVYQRLDLFVIVSSMQHALGGLLTIKSAILKCELLLLIVDLKVNRLISTIFWPVSCN